ncbi:uncharacterized protein MYCGRDRAFT_97693 [Zymoseptoria tritici IPO323]|uniref:Uncharacterized protein n=1 Tax=Zymoseptoria tritici (strain CBS 115943 / IPO323) TaxID=336722 RepID=F9XR06_ZYMTI|nr:uncharacterized protein MYCGRDRAFT_97693 [Zymoseptoria tritici IPO323]EGP82330.1 hypothetical protein MYCGRDRAFT_97693 [Zymoseptoria tritici IPO323]
MARTKTRSAERIAERAESRRVYRRRQPDGTENGSWQAGNNEDSLFVRTEKSASRPPTTPTPRPRVIRTTTPVPRSRQPKDTRTLQPASPPATRPALVLDDPVFKKKEDREREGQLYCDLNPHSIYTACTNNIQLISGHLVFAPRIGVERTRVVGSTLLVSIGVSAMELDEKAHPQVQDNSGSAGDESSGVEGVEGVEDVEGIEGAACFEDVEDVARATGSVGNEPR